MTIKEKIKTNWPFATATFLLGILVVLRIGDIYRNDRLLGIAYLLVAGTLIYSSFMESKRLKLRGLKLYNLPIYAAVILSGMWIIRAFELLS